MDKKLTRKRRASLMQQPFWRFMKTTRGVLKRGSLKV
jgi:hypothetical protein